MLVTARVYVILMAVVFGFGGLGALISPEMFMGQLELLPKSIKGTAEVRGLYGGGFLSWAVILISALRYKSVSAGLFLAMVISMGLIVVARIVSVVVDQEIAFNGPAIVGEALLVLACWVLYKNAKVAPL